MPDQAPVAGRGQVDWGAVLAGAVVAAGAALVLTTLAAGLGFGSVSLGVDGGISVIGLILTGVVSACSMLLPYWLGGYVAGRMRRPVGGRSADGLNGLVVWGLGLILTTMVTGGLIGGTVRAVEEGVHATTEAAGDAMGAVVQEAKDMAGQVHLPGFDDLLPDTIPNNPLDYIADSLLRADGPPPQLPQGEGIEIRRQIIAVLVQLLHRGEISDEDAGFLHRKVAQITGLAEDAAKARVDQAITRVQDIRTETQQKVEAAKSEAEAKLTEAKAVAAGLADKLRLAAMLSAFVMAASALLAALAARAGAIRGGRTREAT
ncbi:hypothetical protein [Paracoccus litorisediminis]|jgi:hypothetical protein|uniref:Uncharacterized protein n=1 Tax=Paracoccus litorisediminis TaxID=2006130 RepID=A0A844HGU8_9RHOB|nr:hypothetical protein [Paracoccus litorisediminis]MTH59070.1 hypothetical protein [Paracoccus litorisediminis]